MTKPHHFKVNKSDEEWRKERLFSEISARQNRKVIKSRTIFQDR